MIFFIGIKILDLVRMHDQLILYKKKEILINTLKKLKNMINRNQKYDKRIDAILEKLKNNVSPSKTEVMCGK
jgi:hypothetical protein